MNEAGVNPVLTDHEVRELQLLIEQRSGIVFDDSRERFLTSRVVEHMQRKRLTYGMELLRMVRASNVEYDNMLERLLTQETRFLRYPGLFSAFEQHVLPEMQSRKFWDKDHALAHLERRLCQRRRAVLDRAERLRGGRYAQRTGSQHHGHRHQPRSPGARRSRRLQHARAGKSFRAADRQLLYPGTATHYKVKPVLREMVKFAPMNLAQPVYLGRFDCIFCMNVLIYFGAELRSKLIQRFYEYLEPGGYLFLGHAESVANVPVKFNQTIHEWGAAAAEAAEPSGQPGTGRGG